MQKNTKKKCEECNNESNGSAHAKKWHTPIVNFFVHEGVGTMIFFIVACPALALDFLVHALEGHASDFTIKVLVYLERGIMVVDACAVFLYILITTYREIKELLDD